MREHWTDKWLCVLNQLVGYAFLWWFDWRLAFGVSFLVSGLLQADRIMRNRRQNVTPSASTAETASSPGHTAV